MRPLNYISGPYLSYSGMPGYNYDVPEGTPVLATADGKLYKAVTDPVNGAGYDYYYNSYIDHQNGFNSWYLYAPLTSAILAEINQNGYAQVTKGQVIGKTIGVMVPLVSPATSDAVNMASLVWPHWVVEA